MFRDRAAVPSISVVDAGHDFQQGRFSGPVLAHDADLGAVEEREVDVIEHDALAVAFADVVHFEDELGRHSRVFIAEKAGEGNALRSVRSFAAIACGSALGGGGGERYAGDMKTPRPKRRWFQFSFRKLVVFVTLSAIPYSWLAVKLGEAKREEEAAAAIAVAGGVVEWDKNAAGSAWLRGVLGEHFLRHLIRVTLQGHQVTDGKLEPLDAMNHVQELALWATHVTDAGLAHLQVLHELKELHIDHADVTNAGLEKLAGLKQLETLRIYGTQVTDAGLGKLAGLKQLQSLGIDGTNVTDAGLEPLQRMKQLTSVLLIDTQATPAGVKKLQQALPNCTISVIP